MANPGAAAEAVLQLADQFRSIIDFADAVKGMGDIDQAIAEKRRVLVTATAALDAKNLDLLDASKAVAKAQEEATAAVASASQVLAAAQTEAAATVADARKDATAIIEKAKTQAEADAEAKMAEMQAAAEQAALKAIGDQLAAINVQIAVKTAECDALTRKIDNLRQTARQIAA